MGALPPVFIEFLGRSTGFSATARGVRTELAEVEAQGGGSMARLGAASKAALLGIGVAAGVAAVKTVHMAADFQTQMTRVRTGAGELQKNMGLVSQGVLTMAGEVGESTKDLTTGLYTVESAGFHGAAALEVLKVSAQGAKVGAADLGSVTDATTTALNAYKLGAGDVTAVMNALVATEASGKTNMEALASSMSSILPVAASAGVGLQEVLAAMATMTAQGTPAKVAATYLRQTIGQLSNPTQKAATEMRNLGLNAHDVSKELGQKGLAATLTTLTDAIEKHMGPGGDVVIKKLKGASGSATEFQKVLANLPPSQQTFIGALATMVGGTKSMMAALQLTGPHMDTFKQNTKTIAQHVKDGGKDVEGWADVQKTFNQRLAEAKGSMEAIGIQIGTVLLPYAMDAIKVFSSMVTWFTKHRTVALALAIAVGTILAIGFAVVTVAVWNFTAALLANPLTWIIVGIMAVVVAIVLLVTHWKAIAAWLSGAWHATVKGLTDAWHWLADQTSAIWNDYIVSPIMTAWDAIVSGLSTAYHFVVDPLVNAWHAISNFTATIWNGITGFFRKWWPLLLVIFFPYVALFIALWNHFHKAVFDFARGIWNQIAGFFSAVWGIITAAAGYAWDAIKLTIIRPLRSAYNLMKSILTQVKKALSEAWDSVHGTASHWWGIIKSAMTGPINSAWKTITTTVDNIKAAISNGLSEAWDAVSGIGDKFYSIGSAIVEGVVSGIEDAAGNIADAVKNAAGDALGKAKSFLGINSPSKVAAKMLGGPIPEGVAKGVRDKAHLAVRAVTDMAAGLPLDSPLGISVGASGGYGSGPIVVHNHVSVSVRGNVMADNDLADTVQRVMARHGARNSTTYQGYKR